jgi:hypothetical protein
VLQSAIYLALLMDFFPLSSASWCLGSPSLPCSLGEQCGKRSRLNRTLRTSPTSRRESKTEDSLKSVHGKRLTLRHHVIDLVDRRPPSVSRDLLAINSCSWLSSATFSEGLSEIHFLDLNPAFLSISGPGCMRPFGCSFSHPSPRSAGGSDRKRA